MTTKFYEDNGGGIHAIVLDDSGTAVNFLTGFHHEKWDVGALLRTAMHGFEDADDYRPEQYDGITLEEIRNELEDTDDLIAEISEKSITLYPPEMGIAGKILFGLEES